MLSSLSLHIHFPLPTYISTLGSWSSCSQGFTPSASLVLSLQTQDWSITPTFPGFQLIYGRLWDFLASKTAWIHFHNKSPHIYIYIHILLVLFLWRTLTNTKVYKWLYQEKRRRNRETKNLVCALFMMFLFLSLPESHSSIPTTFPAHHSLQRPAHSFSSGLGFPDQPTHWTAKNMYFLKHCPVCFSAFMSVTVGSSGPGHKTYLPL